MENLIIKHTITSNFRHQQKQGSPHGEFPCNVGFQNGRSLQVRSRLDALEKVWKCLKDQGIALGKIFLFLYLWETFSLFCALHKRKWGHVTYNNILDKHIFLGELKQGWLESKNRDRRNCRDKMFLTDGGEKKNQELQNSSPCYLQTRTKEAENRSNDSCSLIDRRLA